MFWDGNAKECCCGGLGVWSILCRCSASDRQCLTDLCSCYIVSSGKPAENEPGIDPTCKLDALGRDHPVTPGEHISLPGQHHSMALCSCYCYQVLALHIPLPEIITAACSCWPEVLSMLGCMVHCFSGTAPSPHDHCQLQCHTLRLLAGYELSTDGQRGVARIPG